MKKCMTFVAAMALLGHLLSTRLLAHPFDETLYQYRSAPLPALVALVSTATLFSLFTFSGLPLLLAGGDARDPRRARCSQRGTRLVADPVRRRVGGALHGHDVGARAGCAPLKPVS